MARERKASGVTRACVRREAQAVVRAEVEAEARCIRAEEAEAEATHPAPRFSSGPGGARQTVQGGKVKVIPPSQEKIRQMLGRQLLPQQRANLQAMLLGRQAMGQANVAGGGARR